MPALRLHLLRLALPGRMPYFRRSTGPAQAGLVGGRGTLALRGICFLPAEEAWLAGAVVQPWQSPVGAMGGGNHNIPTKGARQRAGDGAGSQVRGQDPVQGSSRRPPLLDAAWPACSVPGGTEAAVALQTLVPPSGAGCSVAKGQRGRGGSRRPAMARAVLPLGPRQIPPRAWHFNVLCLQKTAF